MAIIHDLYIQRRALLDELDEIEEAVVALAETLRGFTGADDDEFADQRDQLARLRRQHAGVLVVLNETERALLASGADGWDEG